MEKVESAVSLVLFLYLLPGFLGGVVYEAVAEARSRTTFERLLIALVLTLLATMTSNWVFSTPLFPSVRITPESSFDFVLSAFIGRNLVLASAISTALGLLAAFVQNTGWLYAALRRLRITNRSGRIDVWHEIFSKHREIWIQVRLRDGRRLVGWPEYYSEDSQRREVFLAEAIWFIPQVDGTYRPPEIDGPGVYLTDWSAIEALELLDGDDRK